jgi:hypothetical protein
MLEERRRFKRYAVRAGDVQVLVHPGPEFYPIRDISRRGLAIEYTPVPGKTLRSRTVDLVSRRRDRSVLKGLACRTVYDIETLMEGQSFRGGARRVRGLRFLFLTPAQEAQLGILIAQCLRRPPGEGDPQ